MATRTFAPWPRASCVNRSPWSPRRPFCSMTRFARTSGSAAARLRHNLPQSGVVLLFVGRIQPLKSPDVVIRATAAIVAADPTVRGNLTTVVCGGPSGAGPERLDELRKLAATLGVADIVRFVPPTTRDELADWYRAADVVCVPSHSESFGLVPIEAPAWGTPVIAILTADVQSGYQTACTQPIARRACGLSARAAQEPAFSLRAPRAASQGHYS